MPSRESIPAAASPLPPAVPARVLEALGEAIARLRFGVVQLTVHEGRVVQLDVTEKHRF